MQGARLNVWEGGMRGDGVGGVGEGLSCGADELADGLGHADFLEVGVGDCAVEHLLEADAFRLQDGERLVFKVFVGDFEVEDVFFKLAS